MVQRLVNCVVVSFMNRSLKCFLSLAALATMTHMFCGCMRAAVSHQSHSNGNVSVAFPAELEEEDERLASCARG